MWYPYVAGDHVLGGVYKIIILDQGGPKYNGAFRPRLGLGYRPDVICAPSSEPTRGGHHASNTRPPFDRDVRGIRRFFNNLEKVGKIA